MRHHQKMRVRAAICRIAAVSLVLQTILPGAVPAGEAELEFCPDVVPGVVPAGTLELEFCPDVVPGAVPEGVVEEEFCPLLNLSGTEESCPL